MTEMLMPITPEALFERNREELDAIRTAAGFNERQYNYFFKALLHAYALRVQRLPLTPEVYTRVYGAWDFGLTVSILTLRVATTRIFFPTAESEERRKLEPQCLFAAFAAGLATGVALLSQHADISLEDGSEYHPIKSTDDLATWLASSDTPQFSWRPTGGKALNGPECAAIAARFIPAGMLKEFDLRVVYMIFNAINPQAEKSGVESTMAKVVRLSVEKAYEAYLEGAQSSYVAPAETTKGAVPSASAILQAADRMVESTKPPTAEPEFNLHAMPAPPKPNSGDQSVGSTDAADDGDGADPLATANPALKEFFKALTTDERYPQLREKIVETEAGIEMPGQYLGQFGLNALTIRKYMEEAGVALGKSANGKAVVLTKNLRSILLLGSGK